MSTTYISAKQVTFRPQIEGSVPHGTNSTLVLMIWMMQHSCAHSLKVLCAAFVAVTHFFLFLLFLSILWQIVFGLQVHFFSWPPLACLCSACGDKDAPCPSLLVVPDSERCHVGRCGEGEELWRGNLKFKCFERYEWQLFKEYFTWCLSVGSELCKWESISSVETVVTQLRLHNNFKVWFYISSLSSSSMQLEGLRVQLGGPFLPPSKWKCFLIFS